MRILITRMTNIHKPGCDQQRDVAAVVIGRQVVVVQCSITFETYGSYKVELP